MKAQHLQSRSDTMARASSGLRVEALTLLGKGPYSFDVAAGRCVGLSGRSGVGKSVLLKAIADLVEHGGESFLGQVACSSMAAPLWRRQVMLLPAESSWWHDTVEEHFPYSIDDPLVQPLLPRLGFAEDIGHWHVHRLSSGERQRLALLRGLVHAPAVLLLDEPSSALDSSWTEQLESLVHEYQQERGASCVWVSHDSEQLQRVADSCFCVTSGGLEQVAVVRKSVATQSDGAVSWR